MEDKMVDKILDDIVAEVGPKAIEEMTKDDLKNINEPAFEFSKEHEEKMQAIFQNAKKETKETNPQNLKQTHHSFSHRRTSKKIFIIAATIVLLSALLISSVGAWRESFVKYFLNVKEEYSDIQNINKYHNRTEKDRWVGNIYFGYLPEGYELKTKKIFDDLTIIVFENKKKENITIEVSGQSFLKKINTESGEVEEVIINGKDMVYSENHTQKLLTWNEKNKCVYVYTNDTKDILWNVSQNIQIDEMSTVIK